MPKQRNWKSEFVSLLLKQGEILRRQQWKEFLIFISFVLLAFVFWFLQTLQQDYEQRIDFPLRYRNVPAEWVLSEKNPETLSVLLKEKGAALLYYYWHVKTNEIDISLTGLTLTSDTSLQIPARLIDTELSKQLFASTSIVSFEPREIELQFDILSNRLANVLANITLSTKPGFQLSDDISVSPSVVRLYGSAKALEALKEVKTIPITLDNVSKVTELTAHLALPAGIKADRETVLLTIPVEEFTEKKIQIQVECNDIPESYILRMFPSSVEVTCQLPLSQFRELTTEQLKINIPFSEFEENRATGKIPVKVTRKPTWVSNPVVSPGELEFIIEHHD